MLGKNKSQPTLFLVVDIEALVPASHRLRKIDAVLDLSFVRDAVAECYSTSRGRPSIDPELALRMMLLGRLYNLGDRELCDEIGMHVGMRWFCGLNLGVERPPPAPSRAHRARFPGGRPPLGRAHTEGTAEALRTVKDVNVALESAPNPAWREREWVIELLSFVLSDRTVELKGMPLALLADGKLHTFGQSVGNITFIASDLQREIFAPYPHWFLDPKGWSSAASASNPPQTCSG